MIVEACEGADGTSRCSTTHLLRSRSNIIFVAAKSFEICGRALRMHARVLESMRHHESSLLHAENGRCWRSSGSMAHLARNDGSVLRVQT